MSRRWKPRQLLVEAVRNVLDGGARSLLLSGGLLVGFLVPALSEGASTQSIIDRDRAVAERGGFVLTVSPGPDSVSGIDPGACERLGSQGGVIDAGAVISSELVELVSAPGTRVRMMTVTSGAFGVLKLSDSGTASVMTGGDLGAELGVGPGSHLRAVLPSSREPVDLVVEESTSPQALLAELDRAVVVPVAPVRPATTCYASVVPTAYRQLRAGEILGLSDLSEGTAVVGELVQRGAGLSPAQEYADRATRWTFAVGAAMALLAALLVLHGRRSERAVYRTTGTSRTELALLTALEILVATVVSLGVGMGLLCLAAQPLALSREAVAHALHAGSLACATALLLLVVPVGIAGGSGRLLDQLKDR